MPVIGDRRDAVLVTVLVVGRGTEAGPTPQRPAPPRALSRGHTLGVLQTELTHELAAAYVDAVARQATERGRPLEASECVAACEALVSRQPAWVDLPPAFRQAAHAFGDGPPGEAWIHAHVDAPAIKRVAHHVERVAAAARGAAHVIDARTRIEVFAMIAKLALRGGDLRVDQLAEALASGGFTGAHTAKGKRVDVPPLRPGAALGPDWIDAFVRRLDLDGARSWLAEGVGHARRQAKLFARVLATAAGAELVERLAPDLEPGLLSPGAFREHAGLAALARWASTGRVIETEIAAARAASAVPIGRPAATAPTSPGRRPVLRLAQRVTAGAPA